MKCSLGISNFLDEISSLSHSSVSLYFFAIVHLGRLSYLSLLFFGTLPLDGYFFPLIPEEGFLISPCYSLELCIQMGISFLFSLPLASLLFSAICKVSSDNHCLFAFLFLGDGLDHCLLSQTSVHSSSGTLSIRSNPLNLFVTSTV